MSKTPSRRPKVKPVVIVVQSVARRLARMEALIVEMRHAQDLQLKKMARLQAQIDDMIAIQGTPYPTASSPPSVSLPRAMLTS